jgi:hypothetical protein
VFVGFYSIMVVVKKQGRWSLKVKRTGNEGTAQHPQMRENPGLPQSIAEKPW